MPKGMIILTTLGLLAVVGWASWALCASETGRVARLKIRLFSIGFPELLEYESIRSAARIWHEAFNPRISVWTIRGFAPSMAICLVVAFAFDWPTAALVAPFLFFPAIITLGLVLDRRRIRESLRHALLFKGIRLCPCGYNLRDNRSGICPECGAATSA
ncbi:MAG TPA: hypothetical protein P5081_17555 [Phycisphaerae bacterium]|nr:hypothetical protein [Phycisphaerae bacterium]HRW54679.1 hypothetical protein [Phycisphaerae bacterium]